VKKSFLFCREHAFLKTSWCTSLEAHKMAHIASIQSGNCLSELNSAHASSKASTTICPTTQQLPSLLRRKVVNNHQRRRPSFCSKVSSLQAERTPNGRVREHLSYRSPRIDAHLKENAVGAKVPPTVKESSRFSKLGGFSKRGSQGKVACTVGDFVSPVEEPLADAVEPPPVEEELSQLTLIWRAVKLPIYTVALIPILVSQLEEWFRLEFLMEVAKGLQCICAVMIVFYISRLNYTLESHQNGPHSRHYLSRLSFDQNCFRRKFCSKKSPVSLVRSIL
jgi:hypothetical protein